MLSHDLLALKIWFDCLRDGVGEFTAEGAAAFADQLGKAVEKAEHLEATAVNQAVRLTKAQLADPNIIKLPRIPRRVPLQGGDVA